MMRKENVVYPIHMMKYVAIGRSEVLICTAT